MKTLSFPKRRFFYIILMLVLVIAGGLGWYLRRTATNIQNVILISIDTCRADHLSCYGFERQTTPHIDELAGQGIIFKKARTPVPLTLPAHCSMLTGTFPPYHQVHDNISNKLVESHLTLAEILQKNGFVTGGVVSSIVLQNKFGVGQGFNVFQDQFDTVAESYSLVERRGEQASQLAGDFLTSHQNEPFFLFLHYFDPHDAYEPPEPFASLYADDLYSGEIAYTDHCIGQVIDQLKELELYDSTLIIIVGDHGEALGEHGETTHGYYIYQSTIHVPFIIRAPGMDKPKEVEQTVSLVDVAPTILGYLDIAAPAHMQGEDLSAYSRKRNQVDSDREVYTESLTPTKFDCNPIFGVVSDRWSYIHTNHTELYDLQQDPQELHNLASEQIQTVRLLNSHLEDMLVQLPGGAFSDNQLEMDLESRRQLESLGYVGDATVNKFLVIDASKKDPRQMQLYYEHREKAGILYGKKKYEEARVECLKMLSQWPEVSASYFLMTEITYKTRNPAEVIKYGREYLARKTKEIEAGKLTVPTSLFMRTYEMMLRCAYELEDYELVVEFGRRHLQLNPSNPVVMDILATTYFRLGRHQQAFDIWDEVLRIKPDMAEAYGNLGQAHFELGDMDEAIANWSQALQLRPNWTQLRRDLDKAIFFQQLNQSIAQLTEALQEEPDNIDISNDLAQAYYLKGDYEGAIKYWGEVLRFKPDWPEVHNFLGQALYLQEQYEEAVEHWRRALELKPDVPEISSNLAWILATTDDPKLRNPAEAFQLAQQAAELTKFERADILETLSVTYAANGKYTEGISTAEKALKIAVADGNTPLANKLRLHIEQFKSKRDK